MSTTTTINPVAYLPSFRPIPGAHLAPARSCARPGAGGPCWGQVAWVETRDLLRGRCAQALCEGHRFVSYAHSMRAEDASHVFTLTGAEIDAADYEARGAWAARLIAAILAGAGISRADWRTHRAPGLCRISREGANGRQWAQVLVHARGYAPNLYPSICFTVDGNDDVARRLTAAAKAIGCEL